MIAERTGGRPVTVAIPDLVDGDVYIDEDGNVYLVDQVDDGQGQIIERETFLMQVTRRRPDLRSRPSSADSSRGVESGRAEVRDGKLELLGSKQKPKV